MLHGGFCRHSRLCFNNRGRPFFNNRGRLFFRNRGKSLLYYRGRSFFHDLNRGLFYTGLRGLLCLLRLVFHRAGLLGSIGRRGSVVSDALIFPVDGLEIDTVVDHHRFKLGKRTVDKIAQSVVGREVNFVASLDDNALAGVHIHTLTVFHTAHLECAEALDLDQFLLFETIAHHGKHEPHKVFGIGLRHIVLRRKHPRQFRNPYPIHLLPLHSSVFPSPRPPDGSSTPVSGGRAYAAWWMD